MPATTRAEEPTHGSSKRTSQPNQQNQAKNQQTVDVTTMGEVGAAKETHPADTAATSVTITLPDGSRKSFAHAVSVAEIAASIGTGLARAALAGRVNDRLVDLSFVVDHDVTVAI